MSCVMKNRIQCKWSWLSICATWTADCGMFRVIETKVSPRMKSGAGRAAGRGKGKHVRSLVCSNRAAGLLGIAHHVPASFDDYRPHLLVRSEAVKRLTRTRCESRHTSQVTQSSSRPVTFRYQLRISTLTPRPPSRSAPRRSTFISHLPIPAQQALLSSSNKLRPQPPSLPRPFSTSHTKCPPTIRSLSNLRTSPTPRSSKTGKRATDQLTSTARRHQPAAAAAEMRGGTTITTTTGRR